MIKEMFIDTETTGVVPGQSAIIQIAGIVVIDSEVKEEFDIVTKPFEGAVIDPNAIQAHGISNEELYSENRFPYNKGKATLQNIACKYVNKFAKKDKMFFIGYNGWFDASMVRAMWERCGDVYFNSLWWFPIIDVAQMAALKLYNKRHALPNFRLGTVCNFVGIEFNEDDAHDAMYDIRKTYELYKWAKSND